MQAAHDGRPHRKKEASMNATVPAVSLSVAGLSIDCADPAALADFWGKALGRPVGPGAGPGNMAVDAADPADGPRLLFNKVPESKTVKNRLHLDLVTDHYDEEAGRLASLGARPLNEMKLPGVRWTTFADPEGNEFDLITLQPA
jgi:predicted enzyme related to lactoylglutathione lyase